MATGFGPQANQYTTPGSSTYNVPANRSLVYVTMQAAGMGGNGCGAGPFNTGGGGGGAGEMCVRVPYVVTPGGTVSMTVGAGGVGGANPEGVGATGGDTVFGTLRVRGAPNTASSTTFNGGVKGGGTNNGGDGLDGAMGSADGPSSWWAGSTGGPHSSGGNPARIGGPAGGRYGAAAAVSADRGGGPGSSTLFASGAVGAEPGVNGSSGTFGCGGGGGGGSSSVGGTGGNGYIIVEYM